MIEYYDIDGEPITSDEWRTLFEMPEYKVVARTETETYVLSTVWLGLDHQYGEGPPIIFETMVFSRSEWNDDERLGLHDFDCVRYSTQDEARAGHEEMVTLVRATENNDSLALDAQESETTTDCENE